MFRKLLLLYGVAVFALTAVVGWLAFDAAPPSRLLLLATFVTLAAVLPGLIVERWCTQPLRDLTDAARRLLAGEYGHKVYAIRGGEIGRLAAAFNAMSERLADQFAEVEKDRQQLRTILGGLVEGVVAIDDEQRLLFANGKGAELLEFHPKTAIGLKFWEIVRHKALIAAVERALAGRQPVREPCDWKGGRRFDIYVSPLDAGRGAILVLHDTTELHRLERVRHEFVANVSHELKTPLAVIKANVETLLDGAVDDLEARTGFLEQVNEQAERLHNLILDLLSLARMESGNQVLDVQRVHIAEVVNDCLERHRPRADARGQALEFDPPAEPSARDIWTDAEALGQILDNLVDNAVKYTPAGSRIRVHWYGCGDQVCIEVIDNGPGIPEADLPRIFERFYRVDKARSRELGGTGLGLAIVKNLAQILKGTARVTSRVGHGTTFTICLPRTPS